MSEKNCETRIIGYWMSEKKRQKLNWAEFSITCRKHGFDLVKLDLSRSLEDQGPFCIIVHKLTDIIVQAGQGNEKAQAMLERVESYLAAHPEVAVIDPLDNVRKLLDRFHSYSISHRSALGPMGAFTPTFVELVSNDVKENYHRIIDAGVSFPFVCKPSVAHGSSSAHKMSIIFNEKGIKDCRPPCVAQSFVNHNAVLYKIFVLGEDHYVVERPSLKNFYRSSQDTIFYDSHDVSKADSTSSLSILDPGENITSYPPDPEKFRDIVCVLRTELGMSLLGVDVVIENWTGRYAIIDINAYPGYDGFPNFFDNLMKCVLRTIEKHNSKQPDEFSKDSVTNGLDHKFMKPLDYNSEIGTKAGSPTDQDDSGFDTSDSSDEKKKKWESRFRGGMSTPCNK